MKGICLVAYAFHLFCRRKDMRIYHGHYKQAAI